MLRTVVCQAPLSTGFSRQEYWRGWPCPPPRDLPNAEIEPAFLLNWQAGSSATWEAPEYQRLNHLMSLFKSLVGLGRLTNSSQQDCRCSYTVAKASLFALTLILISTVSPIHRILLCSLESCGYCSDTPPASLNGPYFFSKHIFSMFAEKALFSLWCNDFNRHLIIPFSLKGQAC